jgi:hypothetical protein
MQLAGIAVTLMPRQFVPQSLHAELGIAAGFAYAGR